MTHKQSTEMKNHRTYTAVDVQFDLQQKSVQLIKHA